MTAISPPTARVDWQWWLGRLRWYNAALLTAMVLGFVAYLAVLSHYESIICPPIVDSASHWIAYDNEIDLITLIAQCFLGGIALLVANGCYFLGPLVEGLMPSRYRGRYRVWAWRAGTIFSCALPFSIAILHLFFCWFHPNFYDHTPIVVGP